MTLGELIDMLEEEREKYGDDVEVYMAHQPEYPLQEHIGGCVPWNTDAECSEPEFWDPNEPWKPDILYIVCSGQVRPSPYAPREVFNG